MYFLKDCTGLLMGASPEAITFQDDWLDGTYIKAFRVPGCSYSTTFFFSPSIKSDYEVIEIEDSSIPEDYQNLEYKYLNKVFVKLPKREEPNIEARTN